MNDSYLYNENYFNNCKYGIDILRQQAYIQERDRLLKHISGKNILDIGCGTGDFLSLFDDRWNKYGIEPSFYANEIAERKKVYLFNKTEDITSEYMDVVIFRGTLQHISEPMHALFEAKRILKVGGILAILATPNIDSLVYKLWSNLPALDAPRNWVLFGSKMLLNILNRLGFKNIVISYPYWETPYANPINDFSKFFISLFFGYRKFAFPGNMIEIIGEK